MARMWVDWFEGGFDDTWETSGKIEFLEYHEIREEPSRAGLKARKSLN